MTSDKNIFVTKEVWKRKSLRIVEPRVFKRNKKYDISMALFESPVILLVFMLGS